jgi:hypothetical protein
MLILRCTAKLLTALSLDAKTVEPCDDDKRLGAWFVTMFPLQRHRSLLFTHSTTLYSVFLTSVKRSDLPALPELLKQHLAHYLELDEVTPSAIHALIRRYEHHAIAATNDRGVLGSMNDLRFQIEFFAEVKGIQSPVDLALINRAINRVPSTRIGNRYACDRMVALLKGWPK